ncbi:glycosyltransferase [Mesorhizobium sp. BH1-1-4]|uniref:glycosyltransferase n=1 Tax=Mesorhizobium sp. BH1-1-4 TaxID=2876662 RepID=UPI001CD154D6|nr:glycosyltransferase [Mesorhizobium sp. BH1-1-4]MBZ9997326.1 glycosyltransferase [Mesorhizobium sp. BH1-1-4]
MNKHPSAENLQDATPGDQVAPKTRKAGPQAAKRTCIMVLGMHRSGTSALTRAISLLGAELPKNMLGANPTNPAGHWEPLRLIELHDRMLAEAGSSWDDWRAFNLNDLGAPRLRFYKAEIARLIDEEYGTAPLFVLKEPRISRFVPLYAEILKRMHIDVHYVLTERNPLAVIASLEKRGRFTHGFSALLWLRHELEAEYATRGESRVFLSYESMIENWRSGMERMTSALQMEWPQSISSAESGLSTHFSAAHQHHAASRERLEADPRTTRWVKDTYGALMTLEGSPHHAGATAQLDAIRDAFDRVSPVFGDAFYGEIDARCRESARVGSQAQNLADERGVKVGQLATRVEGLLDEAILKDEQILQQEKDIHKLKEDRESNQYKYASELEKLRVQVARMVDERLRTRDAVRNLPAMADVCVEPEVASTNLAARDRSIMALEHEVRERDQTIARLDREIEAIHSSRIWRWGSTMRGLGSFPTKATFYAGRTVKLRALHHLEEVSSLADEWIITGDDPQFELLWPGSEPLPPGHYRLSARVPAEWDALTDMHLYVDSGRGYNEIERINLRFCSNGKGLATATFPISVPTSKLRFDPSARRGQITIGRVRLRLLGGIEYYGGLIGMIAVRHVRAPRSLGQSAMRAAKILREGGPREFAAALRSAEARGAFGSVTYEGWIAVHDTPTSHDIADLRLQLAQLENKPLISVLIPVYNTPEQLLREAIESVRAQIYENWELCIADDCSTQPHVRSVLKEYVKLDARVKVVFRAENGHISRASNSALEIVSGEWVALLDHDDVLRPHALAEVALELDRHPDAELIYSDEDKIDSEGRRYDPCFKPDFSRELFRSQNYLNHLTVHRTENIRAIGGWRPGFEGSQDYDLNLRIFERVARERIRHIPKVLYHWRAVEGSTALDGSQKSYAYIAGLRALEEHVERMRLPAKVEQAPDTPCYRLRFSVPEPQPLVSLVIPTRDRVDLLRGCVTSIHEKTTYKNYEILVVDNGSVEQETLTYFNELKKTTNIRVLRYDKPFNYSAINNFAVQEAKGSIIGLINNDIEVIAPDWLAEMVSWSVQPDIGCVGAKLYYANDTIQHGGVIVGLGGVAGHAHKNFSRHHPGYFARLKVVQNLSAVTAACLLVRKNVFDEVGGLNEVDLTVAFNDVDLCLRVREAGYSNVWTPYAELYHLESVSRGLEDAPDKVARFSAEIEYMQEKWKKVIERDPFYSPNLTRARDDFSLG